MTSFPLLFLLKEVRNGDKALLVTSPATFGQRILPFCTSVSPSAKYWCSILRWSRQKSAMKVLSLFLMHFKTKFSSSLSEIVWEVSFHWTELVFDTMLPQQLTQSHIKRELMSCSLASTHHLDVVTAATAISFLLAVCKFQFLWLCAVKFLIHTLLSKYCGFSCAIA